MTDFIRNILVNAAAANAAAAAATATMNEAAVKAELAKPVNQIQIPATIATVSPACSSLSATSTTALAVEKQRLIKVEIPETTYTHTAAPPCVMTPAASADAGKAQRAARRDVVNARRDKRKTMTNASSPSSPMGLTSGMSSDSEDDDDMEDDKCKKMKTGKTSSIAVVGGLASSTSSETTTKRPSLSSTMPPTPGLLFTPEIDAAGEERLRAMEAQLETLDPDSKEAKKKRRLIRNRMSAQLHRERKKAYVGQLEDQLLEKDRELKLLQEKLAKMMDETDKPTTLPQQQQPTATAKLVAPTPTPTPTIATTTATPTTAPIASPTPTTKTQTQTQMTPLSAAPVSHDEVLIKEEPQCWDAPWPLDAGESWDLHGLEDSEMAELETADLLRDFDDPFAGLGGAEEYADLCKPHHEIHAAKKNLAMMAAVMFSVSFFGNSPTFQNVTPGSNFSSMFDAHTPKDMSQMSIASRIVACLEKTSWKEFRDVSTWLSAAVATAEDAAAGATEQDDHEAVRSVASPSAASDTTDSIGSGSSCGGSPCPMEEDEQDAAMDTTKQLLDEFDYVDEDPFAMYADPAADWLNGDDATGLMQQEEGKHKTTTTTTTTTSYVASASRLYSKLTALWREKNQVLLTVRDDKHQVLQRSVADMSAIRQGMETGNLFASVLGASHSHSQMTEIGAAVGATCGDQQSISFLYPMSAFTNGGVDDASRSGNMVVHGLESMAAASTVDPMFLEVSCQLNGNSHHHAAVAAML